MPQSATGPVPWRGHLHVWPDHWQVVGRLLPNDPHRHISASLLVGLEGEFLLQCDGQQRRTRAALVAPDVVQALDPLGGSLWVSQLDPDCPLWRRLMGRLDGGVSVDLPLPRHWPSPASGTDCSAMAHWLAAYVTRLEGVVTPLDERVAATCRQLRDTLPDRLDLAALASRVGLSGSRLSHLFRHDTGVSLRRFLLHLKLNRALACWQPGMTLSQLAVDAGFYDQPHLVRTAREMYDALPSAYVLAGGFEVCRCQSR